MPRPGFSFLVCPDSRLLQARLEALVSAQGDSGRWERHVHWGDEEPSPRFWEQLTLQGLFGTPRLLVVRQAHLWPAAVWKKISAALARPSEQCWPFFCLEVAWEKGQPKIPAHIAKLRCLGFADQQGWIWRSEGLSERSIKKYVRDRAQALGIPFEADAFEQFCTSVPPDAQAVENELEKLLLLRPADDGQAMPWSVTTDMLATSSWAPECNIFACIRHMEAGNLAAVWKELARGRKDVEGLLFPLLSLLARESRQLWQACAGEKVRFHPSEANAKQQLARRLGPAALAVKLRTEGLRDIGACLSPFSAFEILQGLETLELRMKRHSTSALAFAKYLEAHPQVEWVLYPGLESSRHYPLAQKYLPKGQSGLMSFGIKGGYDAAKKFVDNVKIFRLVANIGDVKSIVTHPASTTHQQLSDEEKNAAGVFENLIRVSVGLEDFEDLKADFDQAFAKAK